jgi:uncharacterized protein (TIGR02444 family)
MQANDSKFWPFSLAVYADTAVQKECLDLQDNYGLDVNLVLFCAFAGAVHGAALTPAAMNEAVALVHEWHGDIVRSLRAARRALKPFETGTSETTAAAAGLRARVKPIELEAERIEQAMLEEWCAAHARGWPKQSPAAAVPHNIRVLYETLALPKVPALPDRLIAAALKAAR